MIRTVIALLLIVAGTAFEAVSVIGIFRFRYILNRMHAAAIGDTFAILFVLSGLIVLEGFTMTSLKLAVIIVFFWLAGPVSSHLISNLVSKVDADRLKESCGHIDQIHRAEGKAVSSDEETNKDTELKI